jgi:hypothetical protein
VGVVLAGRVKDTGEEVARKDLGVFNKYLATLEKNPPDPSDAVTV